MTNDRKESTLHCQIYHSSHVTLGIVETLFTESLDSIPRKLTLAQTPAVHERAILKDHAVVTELAELILFFINQAVFAVGMFVEGGVGLEVELQDLVDYTEASATEDFACFEL